MVRKLQELGVRLELADVARLAPHGSVGRPHMAQALVRAGACRTMNEAFDRFLKRGRLAYVARRPLPPEEAVTAIHAAGGLCILAHPRLLRDDSRVRRLLDLGLDGLEAYHTDHSPAATERYRRLAEERGLLVTGGSDSHGPTASKPVEIGSVAVPDAAWLALQARFACRASGNVV